jgi:subtilisin family serine protease
MSRVPRNRSRFSPRYQHHSRAGSSIRFQVMLALGVVAFIVLSVFMIPVLARQDDALGQREAAFERKADKLLREVHRAAETDRVASEKGRVRDAAESEVMRLSEVAGVRRLSDGGTSVGVNVELTSGSDEELKAAGFAVRARLGDVATVETEVERLPELAALVSVRRLSAATFLHPLNDRARFQVGIDNSNGQRVVSQAGYGVVVGIIDTGIDFRHQDFTVPGTGGRQTRIKALLDMTYYGTATAGQPVPADPGWNYTLPGATATIGHLYTEADINTALQSAKPASQTSDVVKERDKNGHGTHVAGTAAGNGMSSPTPGTYAGMAPGADLIIVKASRQNDGNASFGNDDIINALKFVQQKAAELGEPFVINMSLGGHGGSPHDGTDPDERAIDNLVNGGAGRAVCVAAGNEGGSGIHASGNVPAGGDLALGLNAQSNPGSFTLYYANPDRFSMTVRLPNGTTVNSGAFNGEPVENTYLTIYNGTDDKQDSDPSNDQSSLFVVFKKGAENLGTNWTFTLHGTGVTGDGHFNAWVDDGSFTTFADDSRLVGTPGTSRGAITVGAYVTRSASLPLGSIAPFSSPGPTADGRQKPDITAPGYYLYSARSSDVSGVFGTIGTGFNAPTDSTHYTGLLGTSMATPVVTGSVALMLQANASLTGQQIKDAIRGSASPPSGVTGWDAHFGSGKLNVPGAIALGGKTAYTISGKVLNANAQGVNGVTMTASGSGAATVKTNSDGEYFFTLPRDGTYTITPSVTGFGFNPASQTISNLSADTNALKFTPVIVNPIDDSQNFVTWHYRDFLGRDPDADGLGYWSGELGKCGTDPACLTTRRGGVSAAFFIENEFQLTGSFVYRLYKGALGRQLSYTEFTTDRSLVAGNSADLNASKAAFADAFVQRAEFTQKYLGQNNADAFVDALIATVKASSGADLSSQRATLISTYNTGGSTDQSRSLTVRAAIEDAGFKQAVYNPSFVLMQYFGYLHRNPEQGGYDFWLNVLNNKEPGNYRGMVCSFITSAEYQLRFGQTVTRSNRDCQ